jgi:hypothetical protein
MEFPNRAVILERILAALALMSLLIAGLIESGSPLALALRQGRPWVKYSVGDFEDNHSVNPLLPLLEKEREITKWDHRLFTFAVYQPLGPSLARIVVDKKDEGEISSLFSRLAPSISAKSNAFDRFVWWLEMSRLRPDQTDDVILPKTKAGREELIAKLLYPRKFSPSRLVAVEILNASGVAGLALRAAKVLRSNNVDVVSLGNYSEQVSRTVVYDWTGDPDAARFARRALGCRGAKTVTALDHKKFVDATIILAGDCCATANNFGTENLARLWRRIFFRS